MEEGYLSALRTESEPVLVDRTEIGITIEVAAGQIVVDNQLASLSFPFVAAQAAPVAVAFPQCFPRL